MEQAIVISNLNDFTFCPVSIYFHNLYGDLDKMTYQSTAQVDGTNAHKTIDRKKYSSRKEILQSIDVYSEKYGLIGKIDMFNEKTGVLTERKRTIKRIYDGYVFQVYAQYFALNEMGYEVKKIVLHSITDNRNYKIKLPEEDLEMKYKFEKLIKDMHEFDIERFEQTNVEKCKRCIYEPACDRSKLC